MIVKSLMVYRLAIDIGNSALKAGVFHDEKLVEARQFAHSELELLVDLVEGRVFESGILCSVADYDEECLHILSSRMPVHCLGADSCIPFAIHYRTPETLGFDRLAGVAGGYFRFPGESLLVVDAGTAITYDFLDREKGYLGGGISPGISLRFQSLHEHTARLPLITQSDAFCGEEISVLEQGLSCAGLALVGDDTESCIRSGVLHGVLGEVRHFIELIGNKTGDLRVILTGGGADFLHKNLKCRTFVSQNLVLEGLNGLLRYNE